MKMYKLSLRNKYNPLWNKRIPQKRCRRCIRETRSGRSLSEISMTWSPPISRSSPPSINSAKLRISLSAQHRVENTFGPSVNQVCFHEPSGWRASTTQRPRRSRACDTERNSDERLRRWRRESRVSLNIAGSLSRARATAPRSLGCHARGAEFEPNKCLGQSVGRSGKCGAWRSLSWKVRIVRLVVTHTYTHTDTDTTTFLKIEKVQTFILYYV